MRLRNSTCPAASAPCRWNTCFAISKPIVVACSTDASFGGSLTPSPWHTDAVGGRPPHHPKPTPAQGIKLQILSRGSRFVPLKLTLRLPHCEHTSRLPHAGTVVSGPDYCACSAGSGSLRWLHALHHTINCRWAAAALPSVIGGLEGFTFKIPAM